MRWFDFIKKNGIIFSSILMILLVLTNLGFIFYNNYTLEHSKRVNDDVESIKKASDDIWDDLVRNMDIGVRGYAITQDTALLYPYHLSIRQHDTYIKKLREPLERQKYPHIQGLDTVSIEIKKFQEHAQFLVHLISQNLLDSVKVEITKDKGKTLWLAYLSFSTKLNQYEDNLNTEAEAEYTAAMQRTIIVQIILAIIGVPSLIFTITRIIQDSRKRKKLFMELEKNNRKYLFDPGTEITISNENDLITNSIVNLKKAASFINQISQGNYQVDWDELDEKNKKLNQDNLAGELVEMREKMRKIKEEDERRMWSTEGVAKFSEIIRNNQDDVKTLSEKVITFIVKYLNAQQGSVFMLDDEETHLELTACYAFDRKKYLEKKIEIGEGLVGQTFLEKEPNIFSDLPPGYLSITSGLGEATPGCLLIVPMKYNNKVEAVVEIASFDLFEKFQIEWVQKIGEITASTLTTTRTSVKTKSLLEQFKIQSQMMSSQEEELRQNIEELEATQEEMRRKEIELENRQKELEEKISKSLN